MVLEAALLVEKNTWRTLANRLLVVDVPECVQIERMMRLRNIPEATARAIVACQISRESRLAVADDVLVNNGTLQELKEAVSLLHSKYLALVDKTSYRS